MTRAALFAIALVVGCGRAWASDVWTTPPVTNPVLGSCGMSPGSFFLPGTGGCLRIGGSVSSSIGTSMPTWQGSLQQSGQAARSVTPAFGNLSQISAEARLSADVRIPTELGPVRAYVSIRKPGLNR